MARNLADGVYEDLISEGVQGALAKLAAGRTAEEDPLAESELPAVVARHRAGEIERTLASVHEDERAQAAEGLVRDLLAKLTTISRGDSAAILEQAVAPPPRRLVAIHRDRPPVRPATPLSISTLLTRSAAEPSLGQELAKELASADRVDVIIAFITMGGVRALGEQLEAFARRGSAGADRLRVLTTTFTGTTEVSALDLLGRLPGAKVKVSYDTRRTRLHAKAWLFHRDSGLTTAYVGSANLTHTALGAGQEWMIKACAADLPHVVAKFAGTFDTLWGDPEFEPYDPADEAQRERLRTALKSAPSEAQTTTLIALRPYPFQQAILDRLATERELHGRHRNLVVAATGTGKTVIAALDYARHARQAGLRPRLLFLAHRRELLEGARQTFRHALQDGAFGDLLLSGEKPHSHEHLFATIQSAGGLIEQFGADYWRHVVVDECHHLPAKTYQDIVPSLQPAILVGLTATPERSDGKSLLPDFGGHIATELRLWHALEAQLVVPFEYFGLADGTDLRKARWSRAGYDLGSLSDIFTGHDARANLVLSQWRQRVADVRRSRALGFCVSVRHAEFMARHFTAAGIPAIAVSAESSEDVRRTAPQRLREREVNVVFTCDLYNEGVDLPFVDTLLLLRPTMSATLFLQQLGRGLRLSEGKTSCLVLDFIGQHHEEFRFDNVLPAFTGVSRAGLRKAVEEGFPFLPSGCTLTLDAVARDQIVASLRSSLAGAKRIATELRELSARQGEPTIARYLEETGRSVEELYGGNFGWLKLRSMAGLTKSTPEDEDLSRRLGWLLHTDEPTRLRAYQRLLAGPADAGEALSALDRVRLSMLDFQLNHRGALRASEEVVTYLRDRPAIVAELEQLHEVLDERVSTAGDVYPVPEWPLALHRHYERREIVAAVGHVVPGEKGNVPQGGILGLKEQGRELLFVTLDKSGRSFSPTTRYRDFAKNAALFHWETQAGASVGGSGRRYVDPALRDKTAFYLFVRTDPTAAYAFLGRVRYHAHEGDRPIGITWRLDHELPAVLLERYRTLNPG